MYKGTIGIITFHFSKNYGSALQAYALYKLLLINGYKPKVIDYCPSYHTLCYDTFDPFSVFYEDRGSKSLFYVILRMLKHNLLGAFSFNKKKKNKKFSKFISDNLELTVRYKKVGEIEDCFDIYISGSDQIWNYRCVKDREYGGVYDKAYFLSFAHNKKKIAYAVSAQHGNIRTDLDKDVLNLINDYNYIFTREEALANTLHSLGRKDAETVLDPTLLLEEEDYEMVESSIGIKNDNYILVYNLPGENSPLLKHYTKKMANQTGCLIIDISPRPFISLQSQKIRSCGPAEFLSYIHRARYVVTDSFHAVAFSLIYKKNFNCMLRDSEDERIKNILNLTGLNDKLITSFTDSVNLDPINYQIVDNKLSFEKQKSIDLLLNALRDE